MPLLAVDIFSVVRDVSWLPLEFARSIALSLSRMIIAKLTSNELHYDFTIAIGLDTCHLVLALFLKGNLSDAAPASAQILRHPVLHLNNI